LLEKIELETQHALALLDQSNLSIQVKSLIKNLSTEITQMIADGDWNIAVKLAYYRHEFAKSYNNLDWYIVYIEIRKIRDMLILLRS